jgi:ketopantoate reductase
VPLKNTLPLAKIVAFIDGLGGGMKPSFLLDLEASGPNELDDLSGAVVLQESLARVAVRPDDEW